MNKETCMQEGLLEVKDPLVRMAMWGHNHCPYIKMSECKGYLSAANDRIGLSYLEHCYSVMFKIHRLPGFEYAPINAYSIYHKKNNEITQEDIEKSIKSLTEIYEHTQKSLKSIGVVKDGRVRVWRSMKTYNLDYIYRRSGTNDANEVFYTNILTLYGMPLIGRYTNQCIVKVDVPVEDIVMWSGCIRYPNDDLDCPYVYDTYNKENEVWIINRDIRGKLIVPKENVKYIKNKE